MAEVSISRGGRGQPAEFATIHYPGGRIQVEEFLNGLEAHAGNRSASLPGGMSRKTAQEIWSSPAMQVHLRHFKEIPQRYKNSSCWI